MRIKSGSAGFSLVLACAAITILATKKRPRNHTVEPAQEFHLCSLPRRLVGDVRALPTVVEHYQVALLRGLACAG